MDFPPIHPILVNFTAGLVPVSFLFDLLGAWLKRDVLGAVGWWTLIFAAAITPLTALFGWLWMGSMEHAGHWQMPIHHRLGISLATLVVALALWRGWMYRRGHRPGWLYGLAAAVLLGALTFQGELGASMSFGRGIVISGEERGNHHGLEEPSGGHRHEEPDQHRHAAREHQEHEEPEHGGPATEPHDRGGVMTEQATSPTAAEMLEPLLSGTRPAESPPGQAHRSEPQDAHEQHSEDEHDHQH